MKTEKHFWVEDDCIKIQSQVVTCPNCKEKYDVADLIKYKLMENEKM